MLVLQQLTDQSDADLRLGLGHASDRSGGADIEPVPVTALPSSMSGGQTPMSGGAVGLRSRSDVDEVSVRIAAHDFVEKAGVEVLVEDHGEVVESAAGVSQLVEGMVHASEQSAGVVG